MNIVPLNKTDLTTCMHLKDANDQEVISCLNELLEWLQDINWPVAPHVIDRLSSLGLPLVSPTIAILEGDDDVWKYWLISSLLPEIDIETRNQFIPILRRISNEPTLSEVKEEVNIVSLEVLNEIV